MGRREFIAVHRSQLLGAPANQFNLFLVELRVLRRPDNLTPRTDRSENSDETNPMQARTSRTMVVLGTRIVGIAVLTVLIAALPSDRGQAQTPMLCDQPFDGNIPGMLVSIKRLPGARVAQSQSPDFDVINVHPGNYGTLSR